MKKRWPLCLFILITIGIVLTIQLTSNDIALSPSDENINPFSAGPKIHVAFSTPTEVYYTNELSSPIKVSNGVTGRISDVAIAEDKTTRDAFITFLYLQPTGNPSIGYSTSKTNWAFERVATTSSSRRYSKPTIFLAKNGKPYIFFVYDDSTRPQALIEVIMCRRDNAWNCQSVDKIQSSKIFPHPTLTLDVIYDKTNNYFTIAYAYEDIGSKDDAIQIVRVDDNFKTVGVPVKSLANTNRMYIFNLKLSTLGQLALIDQFSAISWLISSKNSIHLTSPNFNNYELGLLEIGTNPRVPLVTYLDYEKYPRKNAITIYAADPNSAIFQHPTKLIDVYPLDIDKFSTNKRSSLIFSATPPGTNPTKVIVHAKVIDGTTPPGNCGLNNWFYCTSMQSGVGRITDIAIPIEN